MLESGTRQLQIKVVNKCHTQFNSSSFDYHCVINAWGNETIEVCAPQSMIVGNVCAEYNHGGNRIQRIDNVPCEKCPPHYFSNESYNYQKYYEYVRNLKTLKTTQLTTESIDMGSTKQKKSYPSSSLIHDGDTASSFQNIETPNSSHIKITIICVVFGLAAIAVALTVKQRSWAYNMFTQLKKNVIGNIEEGHEVKTILLDKETHNCLQDVCHELNESSDNTNLNAISN